MRKSYKLQYWLSLIPFFGFLVVFIIGMVKIWRTTRKTSCVFLYYLLLIIPLVISALIIYFLYFVVLEIGQPIKAILTMLICYLLFVGVAIVGVLIQKVFVKKIRQKEDQKYLN